MLKNIDNRFLRCDARFRPPLPPRLSHRYYTFRYFCYCFLRMYMYVRLNVTSVLHDEGLNKPLEVNPPFSSLPLFPSPPLLPRLLMRSPLPTNTLSSIPLLFPVPFMKTRACPFFLRILWTLEPLARFLLSK